MKMNCLKTCPLRLSPHPSSPSKPVKLSTTLNKQKWSGGGGGCLSAQRRVLSRPNNFIFFLARNRLVRRGILFSSKISVKKKFPRKHDFFHEIPNFSTPTIFFRENLVILLLHFPFRTFFCKFCGKK
jgi:hypothetical protein